MRNRPFDTAKGVTAQRIAAELFMQIERDWATQIGAEQLGDLRALLESALPQLSNSQDLWIGVSRDLLIAS